MMISSNWPVHLGPSSALRVWVAPSPSVRWCSSSYLDSYRRRRWSASTSGRSHSNSFHHPLGPQAHCEQVVVTSSSIALPGTVRVDQPTRYAYPHFHRRVGEAVLVPFPSIVWMILVIIARLAPIRAVVSLISNIVGTLGWGFSTFDWGFSKSGWGFGTHPFASTILPLSFASPSIPWRRYSPRSSALWYRIASPRASSAARLPIRIGCRYLLSAVVWLTTNTMIIVAKYRPYTISAIFHWRNVVVLFSPKRNILLHVLEEFVVL